MLISRCSTTQMRNVCFTLSAAPASKKIPSPHHHRVTAMRDLAEQVTSPIGVR